MSNWGQGSASSSDEAGKLLRRNGSFSSSSSSSQAYHPIAEEDGDTEQRPSSPSASSHSSHPPSASQQQQQQSAAYPSRSSQSPPPSYTQYTAEDAASPSSAPVAASSPPASSKVVTVNLRTLSGQVMSVQFTSLDAVTVSDLKRRLEATHGIPVSFQRLIFSGRELVDAELCTAYGMEDNSMVHLLLRQNQQPAAAAADAASSSSSLPVAFPVDQSGMANFNGISIPVQPGTDYPAPLSEEEAERLHRTIQLSRAVKILALIDFIWLFVFAVRDPVFLVLGVLLMCGYYGAHHYNRRLVAVFVPYIVLSVGARVFLMIRYPVTSTYVIMAFGLVIDLYLFRLVTLFYRFCSSISAQDRAELIDLNRANFGGGFGY